MPCNTHLTITVCRIMGNVGSSWHALSTILNGTVTAAENSIRTVLPCSPNGSSRSQLIHKHASMGLHLCHSYFMTNIDLLGTIGGARQDSRQFSVGTQGLLSTLPRVTGRNAPRLFDAPVGLVVLELTAFLLLNQQRVSPCGMQLVNISTDADKAYGHHYRGCTIKAAIQVG